MKRDLLEELIKTIEVNAIDNQAKITDVKLWANSWRKEVELEALTPTAVMWQSGQSCGEIHSTDFNGKCFNCGKQFFKRETE